MNIADLCGVVARATRVPVAGRYDTEILLVEGAHAGTRRGGPFLTAARRLTGPPERLGAR
eukprot:CAMPEP_0194339334 /NCGR_PEP_ID=MMETSP0171-20130528/82718_1 /TAXON_ID=218684 /ORGANISM="Corethron pennatum, Strain L29A3" /LENGTH=59 /DNA_ID=CAMNT_0039103847 /DNA_START=153 /DNA_END=328 /DNA_ORIENTATION=+